MHAAVCKNPRVILGYYAVTNSRINTDTTKNHDQQGKFTEHFERICFRRIPHHSQVQKWNLSFFIIFWILAGRTDFSNL